MLLLPTLRCYFLRCCFDADDDDDDPPYPHDGQTSDGELVIFHDELLHYATNGTGFIRKRPYAGYVEYLRVNRQRKVATTSEERVPKFRLLLDLLLKRPYHRAHILLDVKDTNDLVVLDRLRDVLDSVQVDDPSVRPWSERFTIGIWNEAFWYRADRLFGSGRGSGSGPGGGPGHEGGRGFGLSLITKSLRLPWRDPFYRGVGNLNLHFDALKRDKTGFLERMRAHDDDSKESKESISESSPSSSSPSSSQASPPSPHSPRNRTYFGWTINTVEDMQLAIQWRLDSILTDHIRVCRQVVDDHFLRQQQQQQLLLEEQHHQYHHEQGNVARPLFVYP